MNLAILIPGQPRNIHVAYESLKKFYLDKYACDIFIHAWHSDKFSSDDCFKMVDLFKPKSYVCEKQIEFADPAIKDPAWNTPLQNLLSMYYSMNEANKLRNRFGKNYDFVMKMRSDLQIIRPIELEKIESDKLAIYNWTELSYNPVGLSDVFALGNPKIMDAYSDLYNKVMYYLYKDPTWNIGQPKMRAEYLLHHHIITANKIEVQKFWHGDQTDPSFFLIR